MPKPNVLSDAIVMTPVGDIKLHPKNPRKGDIEAIRESIRENGFFSPVAVQTSTSYILIGNHRYQAAIAEGMKEIPVIFLDVDDDHATKIVLSDNRTNDLSSYNVDMLTDLLGKLPSVTGTGYTSNDVNKMLAAQMDKNNDLIQSIVQPKPAVFEETPDEEDWDFAAHVSKAKERGEEKFGPEHGVKPTENILNDFLEKAPSKFGDANELNTAYAIAEVQRNLERLEGMTFAGKNYWGIPELRKDMLVDTLDFANLKTWGGKDATPDDGISTYIWNYGLAASSGLPWDRAVMATFTYDSKFQSLIDDPAFQVAKMLHNGITRAIGVDSSTYTDETRFNHLVSLQNSNWTTRFMQEAGIKIIPRLSWADIESLKYMQIGVPRNAPIVAIAIQTITPEEMVTNQYPEALRLMVKELQPQALVVYGGGTAKKVLEAANLPNSVHVTFVENYVGVRRGVIFDKQEGKALADKHQRSVQREAKNRMEGLRDEEASELSPDEED